MNTTNPQIRWDKVITGPRQETLHEAKHRELIARIVLAGDDGGDQLVVEAIVDPSAVEPRVLKETTFTYRSDAEAYVSKSKRRLAKRLREEAEEHAEAKEKEARIARNYTSTPEGWKLCTGELDNDRIKDSEGYHKDYAGGEHARIYKWETGDCWIAKVQHDRNGGWFCPFYCDRKHATLEAAVKACDEAAAKNSKALAAEDKAVKDLLAHVLKVKKSLTTSTAQHWVWEASEVLKKGVRS